MVGQDLSARNVQLAGTAPQWSLGKSFLGFRPTGPCLVHPGARDTVGVTVGTAGLRGWGAPPPKKRMRFAWFMSYAPAGPISVPWDSPANRGFDYLDVNAWMHMAKKLEAAKFDFFFWADHSGVYDQYMGPRDTNPRDSAIRNAIQFPMNDPMYLVPALATVTENLGFVVSRNIIGHHPFEFARALTTLDHITKGRIGWNIVTSFQKSAWANLGHGEVMEHDARYALAEEYLQVIYRLLEGSWEDDAVVRDLADRIYAEPSKVHEIDPVPGAWEHVVGPHITEPSRQRSPLIVQAGSSGAGRAYGARNAELIFHTPKSMAEAASLNEDVVRQAESFGRRKGDVLNMAAIYPVIGSTEEEAKRKDKEMFDYITTEGLLALYSSILNTDLGQIDIDKPLGDFETNSLEGSLKYLRESGQTKHLTFREYMWGNISARFVGTSEQFADYLEECRDQGGVNGAMLLTRRGIGDLDDFVNDTVPVLQQRGLMQREYTTGSTLRERIFDGEMGPRLPDRHPGAQYRRQPAKA